MRILFADSNHPVLHETLLSAGFHCDLFWDKTVLELQEILPAYDALVIRSRFSLSEALLAKCSQLKCIGRVGAGMENIDVDFAVSKNIQCVSAPEGNRDALGEHALAMLLMLFNNLKKADTEVRNGIWLRAENRGVEITGKTIGIIGCGQMGSSFAEKLRGFNCNILVYDKYKSGLTNEYRKQTDLEELFENCDIVSLHVPLTNETKYMINETFISQFKKPVYIVNTARGKCLNTNDLIKALESGKVKGACLDVLEYESVSFEKIETNPVLQYLFQSNKVILSPHIGGWTHESNYKMSKLIAERMINVLQGV
jgi:D-3-phosphoglycerate dehydrogenase / 2-oxoglutarate reductase